MLLLVTLFFIQRIASFIRRIFDEIVYFKMCLSYCRVVLVSIIFIIAVYNLNVYRCLVFVSFYTIVIEFVVVIGLFA